MRLLLAILLLLAAAPASAQQGQGMSKALVVNSCGGGSLPSGALNQLTMDTTGRLCQSGIGSNVCPQAAAYLARTTGGNDAGNGGNITNLICGLVADGVINGPLTGATGGCGTHLDILYIFARINQIDALLDFCSTAYTATQQFSIPFITNKGFGGPGNGGEVDTSFSPITALSPHFVQNSASFGFWSYATVIEGVPQMGDGIGASSSNIFNYDTSVGFYGRVNSATGGSTGMPQPGLKGLFSVERTSSTLTTLYWDGVSQGNITDPSSAPVGVTDFQIGSVYGAAGASTQIVSAAFAGGPLGPTLELALYNRLRTYMSAVGVP